MNTQDPFRDLLDALAEDRRALHDRIDRLAAVETLMPDDAARYTADRADLERDVRNFCARNDLALAAIRALALALAGNSGRAH